MSERAPHVQQPSLWGRLFGRGARGARGKRATPLGAAATKHPAAPLTHAPTHRPLVLADPLWRVDESGRRVYLPLVVAEREGHWAGVQWWHNGDVEGLLLVAWQERDRTATATCVWQPRVAVHVVEGSAMG